MWWNRDHQINMIFSKRPFDNLDIANVTYLSDQFPGAYRDLSLQTGLRYFVIHTK